MLSLEYLKDTRKNKPKEEKRWGITYGKLWRLWVSVRD